VYIHSQYIRTPITLAALSCAADSSEDESQPEATLTPQARAKRAAPKVPRHVVKEWARYLSDYAVTLFERSDDPLASYNITLRLKEYYGDAVLAVRADRDLATHCFFAVTWPTVRCAVVRRRRTILRGLTSLRMMPSRTQEASLGLTLALWPHSERTCR
jgi:hypothetical protein